MYSAPIIVDAHTIVRPDVAAKVKSRTRPNGECTEWIGMRRNGYGVTEQLGRRIYVHRIAWAIANGPIGKGLEICHTCDNRPCVDPAHLFAGTHRENVADMWQKGRGFYFTPMPGAENPKATTLSTEQVAAVRAMWRDTGRDQRAIARHFGCSQSTIWRIVHRLTRDRS